MESIRFEPKTAKIRGRRFQGIWILHNLVEWLEHWGFGARFMEWRRRNEQDFEHHRRHPLADVKTVVNDLSHILNWSPESIMFIVAKPETKELPRPPILKRNRWRHPEVGAGRGFSSFSEQLPAGRRKWSHATYYCWNGGKESRKRGKENTIKNQGKVRNEITR